MSIAEINRNMYPYLNNSISLYMFDGYGLIEFKNKMKSKRISQNTLNLLISCNGMITIEEALNQYINTVNIEDDMEIFEEIITFSKMIKAGIVNLSGVPLPIAPIISQNNCKGSFFPESLHVELTSACNLNCFYCYRNSSPFVKENRLPTNKLLQVLFEMSTKGLQVVELTGGEPLLHPDFITILKFCCKTFAKVSLLTNATLFNKSIIEEMLPFREKLVINISLDSHIPEEHDKRCQVKGSFQKVTNAIRALADKGFLIRTAMAVDEFNWAHVEPTILLSKELGAKKFTYSTIIPSGRASQSYKPWSIDINNVIKKENYVLEKYSDFIHVMNEHQLKSLKKNGGCGAGHRTYAMDPEGNIRLCVTFDSKDGIIGSVVNQELDEIFANKLTQISSKLMAPKPENCNSCKYTYFCENCILRAVIASKWLGRDKCKWLNDPLAKKWISLLENIKEGHNHKLTNVVHQIKV